MKYTKIENKFLKETMYIGEHESGLGIFVIPKPGCIKKYATFAAKIGSVNNRFIPLGETEPCTVPDGVAHFLEHKMFEQSDGTNAFDKFARYGADANAFTSFTYTCYLFSCTDNFNQNFEHLLNYVQDPYFTKENVDKEQGIIAQEIRMYDDDGQWKVTFNLLKALYHKNPVRIDIAGTVESIAYIDKDVLYKCYNTYYNPSNMVVCVVGDVDADEIFAIADKAILPGRPSGSVKSLYDEEPASVNQKYIESSASVAMPIFEIGFKDNYLKKGDELLKREIAVELITRLLAGRSSRLFTELYEKGLINDTFGTDNSTEAEFAFASFGGESENPQEVKNRLMETICQKRKSGFGADEFERVKKAFYGTYLRGFNDVQTIGGMVTRYILSGINIFSFSDIYNSVDLKYVTEVFNEIFTEDNMAMSVVLPSEK